MKKQRIAVLFGGDSSEYEVSLESAFAVLSHLDAEKYELIPVGITRQGSWFRYYGRMEAIRDDTWHSRSEHCVPAILSPDRQVHGLVEFRQESTCQIRLDLVFPILHGKNGEDGTVQGLCQLAGIPVAGCGITGSVICMDKDRAHKLAGTAGIKVPKSSLLIHPISRQEILAAAQHLHYPVFVKPVKAGSSMGITRITAQTQLFEAVQKAFAYDDEVILEEAIEGVEVGCAILGSKGLKDVVVGEIDEIELHSAFFDYKEKYTLHSSKIHLPARISEETALQIKETAIVLYQLLGCKGFARIDLFLTPQGELVLNEINTIPGFTAHSRYPSMMKAIGLSFTELLDRIIAQEALQV